MKWPQGLDILAFFREDLQHGGRPSTQRNGGNGGLENGMIREAGAKAESKPSPEETPEGNEEKAKKIVAAEQQFQK
jgi:hypothetical protein